MPQECPLFTLSPKHHSASQTCDIFNPTISAIYSLFSTSIQITTLKMFSTNLITAIAAMGNMALIAAAPASSQIPISQPTGSAAITAAPAVPTFPVSGVETDAVDLVAAASGSATVTNSCGFEVYVYVCDQSSCGGVTNVGPNGGTFSTPYTSTLNDGVSIKIGTAPGEVEKPITQLEYTVTSNLVYFDLSDINGNPFGNYGFTLTDTDGLSVHCAPPGNCPFVYQPGDSDDGNMGTIYTINPAGSIGVTLCG